MMDLMLNEGNDEINNLLNFVDSAVIQLRRNPNNITALYTSTSVTTDVKCIIFHNTSEELNRVKIYYNGASTSDQIFDVYIMPLETIEWAPDFPFILNSGETIRGSGSGVNYILTGRQLS
jgi:archaellum component FlaF (FlaF/FlaG flagellin family)